MHNDPMDKQAIVTQLHALQADDAKRSNAARLRDVFPEVERTLASGVTRMEVIKALKENNIVFTLNGFDSTMARIRRQRGKTAAPAAAPGPARRVVEHTAGQGSAEHKSHDPASIDTIISTRPDLGQLAKLGKRK